MNLRAKIIIAIRNFFRIYGKMIAIVFIIWFAIFMINQYLKSRGKEIKLEKGHNLNAPVMDDTKSVPQKEQNKIREIADQYFNLCLSKNYDEAYNMLSEECKSYVYENNVDNFKEYIDEIYDKENKIYSMQNYSNMGQTYIYVFTILDDIEATGTTGGFDIYEERIAFIKRDNTYKISSQNYIQNQKIEKEQEDSFIKVEIKSKDELYDQEKYNLKITNKTSGEVVIADAAGKEQVELVVGNQYRPAKNLIGGNFYLEAGETKEMSFVFNKYFDDETEPSELRLNTVRIYNEDTGELNKNYSFNIKLK